MGAERGFRAGPPTWGPLQQQLRHCEMERGVCVTTTLQKEAAGILQSSERVLFHAVRRCPRVTLSVPTGLPQEARGVSMNADG